jgi:hypothetical protein
MNRIVAAATIGVLVAAAPSVAHADPAGATDYRTEIVAVVPPTARDVVDLAVVGGDAFLEATVRPGHELVVLGYRPDEEPYLRIRPDGVVEHNRRSYATYYNQQRYGTDDVPAIVDTSAPPEWERIGDGGTWAWHDHRAHWMSEQPLIGLDRGDALPPEVVPLIVDGVRVEVEVVTTYLAEPSPFPSMVGLLIGLLVGIVGVWIGRATTVLATCLLATSALVAGASQFWSLPAATGPLVTWWLMPALSLAAALAVIAVYGRSIWVESGLIAFSALQLVVWGWLRRDHLTAAYVPTTLPQGLDRAITAAVVAGAVVVLIGTARAVWRLTQSRAAAAPA